MKKLLILLGIVLIVPFVAGAAYDDVTLATDTVLTLAGYNLNISGSNAVVESITVDNTSFSFVLLSGSSLNVTSADGRILKTDAGGQYIVSSSCSGSDYTLKHSSNVSGSVTVTVTLGTEVCPTDAGGGTGSSGSSSGRGGGGGNSSVAPSPSLIATTVVATTPAAGKAAFTRLLSAGSTGDDVRNLQTRLKSEGLFNHEITGYFGPITAAAVKAYQAKYGIDQLGIVGPVTRAQLNKVVMANENSNAATTSGLTATQVSAIMSQINTLLQQVQVLQAKLKTQSN